MHELAISITIPHGSKYYHSFIAAILTNLKSVYKLSYLQINLTQLSEVQTVHPCTYFTAHIPL